LTLALAKVLATWSVRLGSESPVRVGGKRDSSLSLRLAFRLASRLSPSLANLILFMASGPVESRRCTGYMVYLREHIRDSALQDVPAMRRPHAVGRMWTAESDEMRKRYNDKASNEGRYFPPSSKKLKVK
jgi:hypothetical protein